MVGAIGHSWLDRLLRNPWSGVQTPQVLGYSGLRVAEPLVRGSNPYGAGFPSTVGGWGPTCPIRVHLGVEFREQWAENHPTLTGQDTWDWATLVQLVSHQ
jgi:hypothetical protein